MGSLRPLRLMWSMKYSQKTAWDWFGGRKAKIIRVNLIYAVNSCLASDLSSPDFPWNTYRQHCIPNAWQIHCNLYSYLMLLLPLLRENVMTKTFRLPGQPIWCCCTVTENIYIDQRCISYIRWSVRFSRPYFLNCYLHMLYSPVSL